MCGEFNAENKEETSSNSVKIELADGHIRTTQELINSLKKTKKDQIENNQKDIKKNEEEIAKLNEENGKLLESIFP